MRFTHFTHFTRFVRLSIERLIPCLIACALGLDRPAAAQLGTVRLEQKISETEGGFVGALDPDDRFGSSVALLEDLDGDGVREIAVGAPYDDDGGGDQGAVWILFLACDGTVRTQTKISETSGGFGGNLGHFDFFGSSVAGLGDLDGDGIGDLVVGDPGNLDRGALWILFLNANGTVKSESKVTVADDLDDFFGGSVANLGDLDGDGVVDLAVGAFGDDDGGPTAGAVWILLLHTDGTLKASQKISETSGGGPGRLDDLQAFGNSVASIGDFDHDGTGDIAVGEVGDEEVGNNRGAIWILLLAPDGTLKSARKIVSVAPNDESFGMDIASLGDLDGDGVPELAVGTPDPLWIVFLAADGSVKSAHPIGDDLGGFEGDLHPGDYFGWSVETVGDLDGDGNTELAVGAIGDGGRLQGALWICFLAGARSCVSLDFETDDDFVTPLVNGQHLDVEFGNVATLSSTGPNAGLAIFDSTVHGPNDPSQDRDLLVGRGNILILQTENYPPDAHDVFPRPNDDSDGGTIVFDFATVVEPESVMLIDSDAGDGTTTLTLRDAAGRRRIYTVPGYWTGDWLLSEEGRKTLDLTKLAPQEGYASIATCVQDTGFVPWEVVRLEIRLTGSGAIDELHVCIPGPLARATARNGWGVNPPVLTADSRPVLGTRWSAALDCAHLDSALSTSGLAVLELRRASSGGTLSPFGEVLIGGALVYRASRAYAGSSAAFVLPLPYDVSLCGLELHLQGFCPCAAPSPPRGQKLRTSGGALSNALDLVLGF